MSDIMGAVLAAKVIIDDAGALLQLDVLGLKAQQSQGFLSSMLGKISLVAGAAALVGIGSAAIKMAGDFQQGITSLVTGAGMAKNAQGMVSDAILKMAVDTGTSTKQLIDGMYMISSAGYNAKDALVILQAAAEGAKVGNADLGVVANATTTIMTDFASSHITAAQAVNILVATVASGKTHMTDLSTALSQILPTASAAKVGLNDIMAAMATMTAEGVPAANAATYLRQMIIGLDAPGSKAVKTLKEIGLSSADVSAEMQKSLPGALQMITDALAKKFPVGSAAYVAALKDIAGGSKNMQAFLDLTDTHLQTFKDNVAGISGTVKGAGNSINGWALVQQDFNQHIAQGKEVIETLMIRIGTGLLPIVGNLSGFMAANLLPTIANVAQVIGNVVGWVIKWHAPILAVAGAITVFLLPALIAQGVQLAVNMVKAIAGAIVSFGTMIGTVIAYAAATWAAVAANVALYWPIYLIIAAIAVLVVAIVLLITHWQQVADFTVMIWGHIADFTVMIWNHIADFIGMIWGHITDAFKVALNWVMNAWSVAWNAVDGFIRAVGDRITSTVSSLWNHITSAFGTGIGWIHDKWNALWSGVSSIASNAWDGVKGIIRNGINGVISLINDMIGLADQVPGVNIGKLGYVSFAAGGTMPYTGMALVGERGPELVALNAGAHVYNNSQTTQMMGGKTINLYGPTSDQLMRQLQLDQQREVALYGRR